MGLVKRVFGTTLHQIFQQTKKNISVVDLFVPGKNEAHCGRNSGEGMAQLIVPPVSAQSVALPGWQLISAVQLVNESYESSKARPATGNLLSGIPFWMLERPLLKFGKGSIRTSSRGTKTQRS